MEQAARASGDEAVQIVAVGQLGQRSSPFIEPLHLLQQGEGLVRLDDPLEDFAGRVVVERGAGAGQADADPGDESADDLEDHLRVGLPDVAVTRDLGQRWQRGHELEHIAGDGRSFLENRRQLRHSVGQIGQQGVVEQSGEFGQVLRLPGEVSGHRGRCFADRIAHRAASMRATTYSGFHCTRHSSWNVPFLPRVS